MGVTQFTTRQLGANSVNRDDIDTSTSGKAVAVKIIAGTNVTISSTGADSGTGDVTINASGGGGGGGVSWAVITASQAAAVDSGYVTNSASLVTVTLPSTAAVGKQVSVGGYGTGGWKLAQPASAIIHFSDLNTTTGTGGYLSSNERYDVVTVVCVVANTEWLVVYSIGNITIV